ncbi:MAG: hypothetical protein GXP37_15175 [Chloroflexi bacterium]|nr:hypothetical protein [Chloroflexota bacterium]
MTPQGLRCGLTKTEIRAPEPVGLAAVIGKGNAALPKTLANLLFPRSHDRSRCGRGNALPG